ncbi:hypothetical protein ABS767_10985 [Sphingomonas sp. ST-64]|uniref:Uncharacterized protein n=1 Tax=Sphingomonas plantiphila TaxID=3163295 RepID=A0ABW8YN82_9SPHN
MTPAIPAVVALAGAAGAGAGANGVAATGWRTGIDDDERDGCEPDVAGREDGTTPDEQAPNSAASAATPQTRMVTPSLPRSRSGIAA